jgi:hypothetical protein
MVISIIVGIVGAISAFMLKKEVEEDSPQAGGMVYAT